MSRRHAAKAVILQTCLHLMLEVGLSLDEVLARYPREADWLRGELETARWLAHQGTAMRPSEDFLAESRRRLQREITRQAHSRVARQRFELAPSFSALRVAVTLLSVFGLVLMSTGVAAAAALPGDPIYPLKLEIEEARLLFAPEAAQQTQLRLHFARERLEEIDALAAEERYDSIPVALENYHYQIRNAEILLSQVADENQQQARLLAKSMVLTFQAAERVLVDLPPTLPSDVDAAVTRSLRIVAEEMDDTLNGFRLGAEDVVEPLPVGGADRGDAVAPDLTPTEEGVFTRAGDTPSPELTDTPEPTHTPEATPTSRASNTPKPTKTPRPTNTPRPSNTPKPSKTPKLTKTPKPAPVNPGQGQGNNNGSGKDNGRGKGQGPDK